MKTTDHFKRNIQMYLGQRAIKDNLFAVSFANPDKNIDDCITYILNTVKQSGCNGFADDEIYSLATHYYDEIDVEVGNSINCHVVVNHTVELTAEEKEQARRDAIKRAENEAYTKLQQQREKAIAKRTATIGQPQSSLFDL